MLLNLLFLAFFLAGGAYLVYLLIKRSRANSRKEVGIMKQIELNSQVRAQCIAEIKSFFLTERDEDISDFQAGALLDFILKNLGPKMYNQAINDAHQLMSSKVDELYTLEKRAR